MIGLGKPAAAMAHLLGKYMKNRQKFMPIKGLMC
jgi:hypothetical protein